MENTLQLENLREKQLEEATERLKLLKVLYDVRRNLKRKLYFSERQNKVFNAVLYCLEDSEILDRVKEFEERSNCFVYHLQLTHTEFGDMWAMLFVSDDIEDWKQERKNLYLGIARANVICGEIEEVGDIGIVPSMGGILRTW